MAAPLELITFIEPLSKLAYEPGFPLVFEAHNAVCPDAEYESPLIVEAIPSFDTAQYPCDVD